MDRRRFLKDAAQAGSGLTVAGSLWAAEPRRTYADASNPAAGVAAGTPVVSLDGEWRLATDPKNVGRSQQWYATPLAGATPGRVPGIIQEIFPAYHGVAWHERDVVAPANPHGQGRYLLRFGAVDYLADVWVNGTHLGGHEGGETPFILDVTDVLKPDTSNRVTVRVLNPTDEPIDGIVLGETPRLCKVVSYANGNLYDYGGIFGSVELLLAPPVRVEDIHVRPDWKTGKIRIRVNVRNATKKVAQGNLEFSVAPGAGGETLIATRLERALQPGDTPIETELQIENPHLWSLEDPYLYRLSAQALATELNSADEATVRCGFREFRVGNDGYFRLNGKRLFLRGTLTVGHCPVGQRIPPAQAPDLLRRDALYMKASGFQIVRFVGVAQPYQLDLCDEIGLMVYEESMAGWKLDNSPKMKERYDRSTREMILRDRNHPSVVAWEMLNENDDGPVFRHAVETLPLVRSLDDARLVLLSSGRFDCDPSIGSVSNPGSSEWEHVWGKEAPGAARLPRWNMAGYPSTLGSGDFHIYPQVPQTPEANHFLRTLGHNSKPVFISEYGTGSLLNAIHETRRYEQAGVNPDIEDYALMRSMAERFSNDWIRYGMDGVYAFPEDMLEDSQLRLAHFRTQNFDLIRSNPKLCGFSVTGMEDGGLTGLGLWGFWRDWKPGTMDAIQDGWAALRWCLFVEPMHGYVGRGLKVEAVLANEDVLRPGEYPARFRICGPTGIVWERQSIVKIPQPAAGEEGPLAVKALLEEVSLDGPAGVYTLVADLEHGGGPSGRSLQFYLSDASALPTVKQTVTLWGIDDKVESWLRAHGLQCERFSGSEQQRREIILVGDLSKTGSDANAWRELAQRMARGSVIVFLSPAAFQREKDPVGWVPLSEKGRCYRYGEVSVFHKECVAKAHPIFDGLQAKGIMDWDYYGPVIPHYLFDGQPAPDDVAAAAFDVGSMGSNVGYASGVLAAAYRCSVRADSFTAIGTGMFVLNTFPILENLGSHPAADRLLLNLITYAAKSAVEPITALPEDFEGQLKKIGYI
jgi:hypothetical protein